MSDFCSDIGYLYRFRLSDISLLIMSLIMYNCVIKQLKFYKCTFEKLYGYGHFLFFYILIPAVKIGTHLQCMFVRISHFEEWLMKTCFCVMLYLYLMDKGKSRITN